MKEPLTEIAVPVIQWAEFRDKYRQALIDWLEDHRLQTADCLLNEGIPKMDKENLEPFITWTFLRLHPELPNQYFVQTERCFWLVSLGDCLCWMQDTD